MIAHIIGIGKRRILKKSEMETGKGFEASPKGGKMDPKAVSSGRFRSNGPGSVSIIVFDISVRNPI